jgi:hypothetical protein
MSRASFQGDVRFVGRVASARVPSLWLHGNIDLVRGGELDGFRVTGVGMAKDTQSWIACQNPLETTLGIFGAVGDHDHAGVLRVTDTDAATVVN